MAYVMSIRAQTSGNTPAREILTAKQLVTFTSPFSEGQTITLASVGSGLIAQSIIFGYMDKILTQSQTILPGGVLPDYSVTGADELTLLFGDDPTVYADGTIWGQITYQYYA